MAQDKSKPNENFARSRDFLFNLRNRGSKYGLSRMETFARLAGNPERKFPVIHVAGTNGKGSVCALVESALRMAGYRTGLYTSPHLVHLGERIRVGGAIMPEAEIVEQTARLRTLAAEMDQEGGEGYPSFFEFMTLMAFHRFAEAQVDCAVIEVGLGGRLDATNVVRPEVTAITSIGLDHTEILGETHEQIAAEKAGILKSGVPVILGRLPEAAEAVIRAKAESLGCPVVSVQERFVGTELPTTSLVGGFQRWNAGVASLILEAVGPRFPISPDRVERAFHEIRWPGRWEEREVGGSRIVFDSTHNPEGAVELDKNLRSRFGQPANQLDIVVGSLGKARVEAILRVVAPYARRIFLVKPSQLRALDFIEMKFLMPIGYTGAVCESSVDGLFPGGDQFTLSPGESPVLVTGSIYLLGEIYSRIDAPEGHSSDLQDRMP